MSFIIQSSQSQWQSQIHNSTVVRVAKLNRPRTTGPRRQRAASWFCLYVCAYKYVYIHMYVCVCICSSLFLISYLQSTFRLLTSSLSLKWWVLAIERNKTANFIYKYIYKAFLQHIPLRCVLSAATQSLGKREPFFYLVFALLLFFLQYMYVYVCCCLFLL